MAQDHWRPIREARLAREAADAEAARLQAEQEHTARVELVADAIRAHPELLAGDPAEPGQAGRDGRDGIDGKDGAPAPHVVDATFERGAYGYISGVLETLSDGTTRHYTVERANNRPMGLRLDP